MEMTFNITQNNPKLPSKGFVEVIIYGIVNNRHTLHLKNFSRQLGTMRIDIT